MKKIFKNISLIAFVAVVAIGCKRDSDYVLSRPSPFISNFDLKKVYKETDLNLSADVMGGASSIKGVVVSDFSANNSPAGMLVIQNSRMVGNGIDSVRGIAINIGSEAASYSFGDSLHVKVEGGILRRVDGILQITGLNTSAINKVASGKTVKIPVVNVGALLASPKTYENTLVTISNAVVEPEPVDGDTFSGDKLINDGFGRAILHTEPNALFAANQLPPSANFTGMVYYNGQSQPQLWMRTADDSFELPLVKPSPVIIVGYLPDPGGSDAVNNPSASNYGQYEYIQLMATRDVDFSVTPFSLVTTNNAGANTPTGFPVQGWATGGLRTYKFNLTSGSVRKGELFYVGGLSKRIWGYNSTDIASANWISVANYAVDNGADFGSPTTNLLANSGNIAGIAVFDGTTVSATTVPLDVVMYGGNGQFYTAGPPERGYRITNTDFYSTINPSTRSSQHFYGAGSNTNKLGFQTSSSFIRLGGIYNVNTGRWTKGRSLLNISMSASATLDVIEMGDGLTVLED
ncbi:DUF5689 domain-containing protein [Pedobacter helvus]|uniref:DUF5689 domain-containing protein n=1 Tax=Pedobacter helvus TaxID=2563444 RepID=A0ABW9JJC7_9SPHI|nr:DUF5689 domain-containing protein [Pedobacter ureilyticus]